MRGVGDLDDDEMEMDAEVAAPSAGRVAAGGNIQGTFDYDGDGRVRVSSLVDEYETRVEAAHRSAGGNKPRSRRASDASGTASSFIQRQVAKQRKRGSWDDRIGSELDIGDAEDGGEMVSPMPTSVSPTKPTSVSLSKGAGVLGPLPFGDAPAVTPGGQPPMHPGAPMQPPLLTPHTAASAGSTAAPAVARSVDGGGSSVAAYGVPVGGGRPLAFKPSPGAPSLPPSTAMKRTPSFATGPPPAPGGPSDRLSGSTSSRRNSSFPPSASSSNSSKSPVRRATTAAFLTAVKSDGAMEGASLQSRQSSSLQSHQSSSQPQLSRHSRRASDASIGTASSFIQSQIARQKHRGNWDKKIEDSGSSQRDLMATASHEDLGSSMHSLHSRRSSSSRQSTRERRMTTREKMRRASDASTGTSSSFIQRQIARQKTRGNWDEDLENRSLGADGSRGSDGDNESVSDVSSDGHHARQRSGTFSEDEADHAHDPPAAAAPSAAAVGPAVSTADMSRQSRRTTSSSNSSTSNLLGRLGRCPAERGAGLVLSRPAAETEASLSWLDFAGVHGPEGGGAGAQASQEPKPSGPSGGDERPLVISRQMAETGGTYSWTDLAGVQGGGPSEGSSGSKEKKADISPQPLPSLQRQDSSTSTASTGTKSSFIQEQIRKQKKRGNWNTGIVDSGSESVKSSGEDEGHEDFNTSSSFNASSSQSMMTEVTEGPSELSERAAAPEAAPFTR